MMGDKLLNTFNITIITEGLDIAFVKKFSTLK